VELLPLALALVAELAVRVEVVFSVVVEPDVFLVSLEFSVSLVLALLLVEMLALEPPEAEASEVAAAQES
jgi:hypothetical protein